MSIEAMKQALAKFEHLWEIGIDAVYKVELLPEIRALRQAIEQAEKQKPIAWLYIEPSNIYGNVHVDDCDYSQFPDDEWIAVYTAPPKREWVGLAEDEVKHYNNRLSGSNVAQEIESKLRERNT